MIFRVAAFVLLSVASAAAKPVDFLREIRPILSENCFQCHGPDSKNRMANLRLDVKDAAFEKRRAGAAIVPAKAEESLLYKRIVATDPNRRMPPAYSHKQVTEAQAATIKRWIEEGATWKEHWAYQPPAPTTTLPAVRNAAWVRNPIDRFILAKLESNLLAPAPVADKRTLIRRVALDLTGLPPTPAEVDAFVKDASPNAYERLIDAYLASPHYGEHRARYWLDAARYGDTHGIHVDNYREMWPYRDWVIQAFNRNLGFDQFTIDQLAGDLLPNATLEQKIASGFQRCNVTTNEAGLIEDEYAEIYAKDRADTTGAVWLGLTVGCATCHDHKFDPITAKDFYSLGAFFRNTTQRVMDDNIPDTPPILVVPTPEDRDRWNAVNARLAEIRADLLKTRAAAKLPRDYQTPPTARPLDQQAELYTANLKALDEAAANLAHLGETPNANINALFFHENTGVKVPDAPPLDADKPFTVSVGFYFPKAEQGYTIAAQQDPNDKNRGWVIDVGARVAGMRLVGDNGLNIEVRAAHLEQIKHGSWNHLVVSYDGSRHQSGLTLYLNGRAISTQGRGNQNVNLPGSIAPANTPLLLGRSLASGAIADFRIFNRVVSESEALLLSQWLLVEAGDPDALLTYWLLKENPAYGRLSAEQNTLNIEAKSIARRAATTLVMNERTDQTPFAHVLFRGAYDQKRQRVDASTPSILPPMKEGEPRNRLGLARWLMDPENPMTARVTVNRMWQEVFGVGLVKSTDDFGSQGEMPVNQELLDWLAVDFRDSKWDIKRFYKQVLLSAAYRQAAVATPLKLSKDPENRLLSRGPRFRMDAEMVRDYALASSGLLTPAIGGPSVKPYQPEGVWEAVAMIGSNTRFYKRDEGDKLYRRSLYTFWKRSAPPASMDIFNAPSREACAVRRERTNTPLQALVTMNDTQFVEAARALAEGAYKAGATVDARVDYLSLHAAARLFTPAEKLIAMKAYRTYMQRFDTHPEEAKKLMQVGDKKPDAAIPATEYAALTMLANQILNLDEVLNK
jgi:mono/diheme cytochrome c family protein